MQWIKNLDGEGKEIWKVKNLNGERNRSLGCALIWSSLGTSFLSSPACRQRNNLFYMNFL